MSARLRLEFDGLDTDGLRAVLAACAKARDLPGVKYHDLNGSGAPWAPRVHCDGPYCFHVYTPPLTVAAAMAVAEAVLQSNAEHADPRMPEPLARRLAMES